MNLLSKEYITKLVALLMVLLPLIVDAQKEDNRNRFKATVLLGFNAAQLDGDELKGYNKVGLLAGVRGTTILNEKWSGDVELLFSQKGSSETIKPVDTTDGRYQIHLNYVEVPLLVSYHLEKLSIRFGASYARLLGAKTAEGVNDFLDDFFKKNDFSILAGVDYHFNEIWGIELRFTRSVVNILDTTQINHNALNGHHFGMVVSYKI